MTVDKRQLFWGKSVSSQVMGGSHWNITEQMDVKLIWFETNDIEANDDSSLKGSHQSQAQDLTEATLSYFFSLEATAGIRLVLTKQKERASSQLFTVGNNYNWHIFPTCKDK